MTINTLNANDSRCYNVGWIGFTRTFDSVGDAIAYGERREVEQGFPSVNHALVVTGRGECVQAHIDDGVQYGKLSDYINDPKSRVYFRRPIGWDPLLAMNIALDAESKIGCGYDKLLIAEMAAADTLLGEAVNAVFKDWPHRELSQALSRPDQFICSQLAAYALASQPEFKACPLFKNPLASIDPQSLFEAGPFEDFINAVIPNTNPGGPDARIQQQPARDESESAQAASGNS